MGINRNKTEEFMCSDCSYHVKWLVENLLKFQHILIFLVMFANNNSLSAPWFWRLEFLRRQG